MAQITGDSPEAVAFALLEKIAVSEKKAWTGNDMERGWTLADRQWTLDAYAECLSAAERTRVQPFSHRR